MQAENSSLRRLAELIGKESMQKIIEQARSLIPRSKVEDNEEDFEGIAKMVMEKTDKFFPEPGNERRVEFAENELNEIIRGELSSISGPTVH